MSATDWQVISQNDLQGDRLIGGRIRAYCHLHGSDHQRSLSISSDTGFGECHACHEKVLVRELNPEAAMNIENSQAALTEGRIKVHDPKYIKIEPRRPVPTPLEHWQKEELRILREIQAGMERLLNEEQAQAYLAQRGISLQTAKAHHVGYIPATLPTKYEAITKWCDHLVFPVYHPEHGLQFAGRNLYLWQPGMDENEHKKLLELLEGKGIRRWRKTHAGGWFNRKSLEGRKDAIFCEGAFDALSLIEAGLPNAIAAVGTELKVEWVPKHLAQIVLAFDGDNSGREKSEKARDELYLRGFDVSICNPPDDDMGKDWSERYRRYGRKGLKPLFSLSMCQECGAASWIITDENDAYCKGCWRALGHAPVPGEECCLCGDFSDILDEDRMRPYCDNCWQKREEIA